MNEPKTKGKDKRLLRKRQSISLDYVKRYQEQDDNMKEVNCSVNKTRLEVCFYLFNTSAFDETRQILRSVHLQG